MGVCSRGEVSRLTGGKWWGWIFILYYMLSTYTQNITLHLGCIELLKIRELFNQNIP